eukprot:6194016-Pleurochrysis_carterae.AAC.1
MANSICAHSTQCQSRIAAVVFYVRRYICIHSVSAYLVRKSPTFRGCAINANCCGHVGEFEIIPDAHGDTLINEALCLSRDDMCVRPGLPFPQHTPVWRATAVAATARCILNEALQYRSGA